MSTGRQRSVIENHIEFYDGSNPVVTTQSLNTRLDGRGEEQFEACMRYLIGLDILGKAQRCMTTSLQMMLWLGEQASVHMGPLQNVATRLIGAIGFFVRPPQEQRDVERVVQARPVM